MKRTGKFAAVIGCLALFAACTKSENNNNNNNNNNNTLTKKQMLEAGKWQISAATATANVMGKDTTIDFYAQMDACDKDDFILFATDGTGSVDESTNKCTDDDQVETFTWVLYSNDTKLAVYDDNPDTMDVLELTSTQIKLQMTEMDGGTAVTATQTLKNIK